MCLCIAALTGWTVMSVLFKDNKYTLKFNKYRSLYTCCRLSAGSRYINNTDRHFIDFYL